MRILDSSSSSSSSHAIARTGYVQGGARVRQKTFRATTLISGSVGSGSTLNSTVIHHDIGTHAHLLRRGSCRSGTRDSGGHTPPGRFVSISGAASLVLVLHAPHLLSTEQGSRVGPLLLPEYSRFRLRQAPGPLRQASALTSTNSSGAWVSCVSSRVVDGSLLSARRLPRAGRLGHRRRSASVKPFCLKVCVPWASYSLAPTTPLV